jgi:hypothetical protein
VCGGGGGVALLFPNIIFMFTTLLVGITGISLHMQWPLTSQFSQREQLFFFKHHTLIRLGVSMPSFDTGARNGVLCGSRQSHEPLNKFGLAKVWARVFQMTHRCSIHYSTSSCSAVTKLSKNENQSQLFFSAKSQFFQSGIEELCTARGDMFLRTNAKL